jgi:peptide/nickel transport system substrate-binding protein
MRRTILWPLIAALALVFALGLTACGGDDDEGGGGGGDGDLTFEDFPPNTTAPDDAKKGGTLTVVSSGDIDFMDPGAAYYQTTYILDYAVFRGLLGWPPDEDEAPQPDLADGEPQVSDGGKTVTFKIKDGIRYSPPVNREIKAADFKYAIERGLLPGVATSYISSYFGDVVGFDKAVAAAEKDPTVAPDISGITTPDDRTLVIKMTKPGAPVIIGSMSLPLGAPVPEEIAKPLDRESPSAYGEFAVGTGPYMVESNAEGKLTGYSPGKSITMVRNPNWDESTDYRPAYLDRIEWQEGFTDVNSATRKILSGDSQVNGDILPEPQGLKLAATEFPDQLALIEGSGDRYPALNTSKPPFNDINVRKAVLAGVDREAILLARGGPLAGQVPTHFLFPLIPGFEESGGEEGFGFDFMSDPNGNPEVAAKYFRKAGYKSGKYEGDEEILVIGENSGVDKRVSEVVRDELSKLGFNVNLQEVSSDTMYTKFCNVVATNYDVCSTVGWIADFRDPQAVLQVPFSGGAINPTNNSNWPLLDVPAINKAIDKAVYITDPEERAQAWADVNKMITAQAPAFIYNWDTQPEIWSSNVNAVTSLNNSTIDLSFTSLKNP